MLRYKNKIVKCLKHFVNGVYSGIPICCVLHFVSKVYSGIRAVAKKDDKARGFIWGDKDNQPAFYQEARYCLCDSCFKKERVVKIKFNGIIFRV